MSYWEDNRHRVNVGDVFTTEDGHTVVLVQMRRDGTYEADRWDNGIWRMVEYETGEPFYISLSDLRDKMPPTYRPPVAAVEEAPRMRYEWTTALNTALDTIPEDASYE